MNRWSGKVAVVTGASSGIGLATAKAMVREGLIVVGLARRKEKMENDMKDVLQEGLGKFYARKCDVTEEKNVIDAFDWIKQTVGTVHILINNAGVLKSTKIEDATTEDLQLIINVNLIALLYCTRQAIKLMKANGEEGQIVNINSIVGHITPRLDGHYLNIYPATKFAVRSISETLTHELQGNKIRVSNLSPGYVKTKIFDVGNMDVTAFGEIPALTSEDVAQSILYVIAVPAHVQITELTIRPFGERF